jgi:hypothetical protein
MMKLKHIAVALGTGALLTSSAVAHASPMQPTPDEVGTNAVQICGFLNQDPTDNGVIIAGDNLGSKGFSGPATAYILFHAIIYTCPQHEQLVFDTIAATMPEGCI